LAIITSEAPGLYIPSRELIVYHRHPRTYFVPLEDIVNKVGDLSGIVRIALFNLLTKLQELSISFRSIDLSVEHDFEIVSWKYAVVSVELEIREEIFDEVNDLLMDCTYSNLPKEETSKVLLVINRV